jgi:thiamine biosynthesis lipoprotein
MHRLHRKHRAMATEFEAILVGEDLEHLDAVCAAAFEEIDRVERLLSRFDPASEVYRVNREAKERPVKVSVELAEVIEDCRQWFERTQGAFDVTFSSSGRAGWQSIDFDVRRRTICFYDDTIGLDFGGYGKGYALDRIRLLLIGCGVKQAFLHGGTSSVLALGRNIDGELWQIDLLSGEPLAIQDIAVSTSEAASCAATVLVPTGVEAEVFSTTATVLGYDRAREFFASDCLTELAIAWFERGEMKWMIPQHLTGHAC